MGYLMEWYHDFIGQLRELLSGTFNIVESESLKDDILILWIIAYWLYWM